MTDGLKDVHREAIIATIAANDRVERAVLFGSGATGTNTVSLDIDIALFGAELTLTDQVRLAAALDAIQMAQSVNLLLCDSVTNKTLLERIRRDGVEWYVRPPKRASTPATPPVGTTHPRGLPPPEWIYWPLEPARDLFKLTYGRALAARDRRPGDVPVYGTNGRCGSHDAALFEGPGVVLGRKGQGPLGVEWSGGPYWVIDTAYTLTPLRADVHLKFAYYLLKYIGLNHLKDGTSNPTLSRETFGAQALPRPPLPSQRTIADVLGTLDEKIELNRRMNATLEAMARALFRSWFVDFDPVRAKMEGRDTGLAMDIADLFPDRLVDSELGEIPEGWESTGLDSVATITKGRSYRRRELVASDTALVTLKSFARGGGYRAEGLKPFSGVYKSEQVVRPGEVIVACTDVTQAAEVVGRSAVVGETSSFRTLVASLDVLSVRPKNAAPGRAFLYYVTGTENYVAHVRARTTGTTVLHLAKDAVASFRFALPPRPLMERFGHCADSLRGRIQANTSAVGLLADLRDTLLPKLVSGELRVPGQGPAWVHEDRPASVGAHEA